MFNIVQRKWGSHQWGLKQPTQACSQNPSTQQPVANHSCSPPNGRSHEGTYQPNFLTSYDPSNDPPSIPLLTSTSELFTRRVCWESHLPSSCMTWLEQMGISWNFSVPITSSPLNHRSCPITFASSLNLFGLCDIGVLKMKRGTPHCIHSFQSSFSWPFSLRAVGPPNVMFVGLDSPQ